MPRPKTGAENLQRENVVTEAIEVTGYELAVALALIVSGIAPLGFCWLVLWKRTFDLQEWIALHVLGLYAFLVIETFAVILLVGFRRLRLPEGFAKWLGGIAFGEMAGMLLYVVKKVF